MRRIFLLAASAAAVMTGGSCGNGGADRSVGITATGAVLGVVMLDANGNGIVDASDVAFEGARVRLLTPIAGDTVARATANASGTFRLSGVPVGSYRLVLDPTSVGDTLVVTGVDAAVLNVRPQDSVTVAALAAYPSTDAAGVRSGTLGTRVFLAGVALHALGTYSDTLLHVVDTSGAIRAGRVRPATVAAGDSLRLLGRIATRDGQRVLDDVRVFALGSAFIPTSPIITTLQAATAAAGTLDAALVRVFDAAIVDSATVAGSLRLTVNDGSGALTVLLDRAADDAFRPPFMAGIWSAGQRYDFAGVLVPLGVGSWALRPRTEFDLTPR
ncbi:MAG: hypothetical protein KF709_05955 [Gemmatimonadaceae bacterium]|nr:hypothetical protein [Gemmatimonadaceae bacterium]